MSAFLVDDQIMHRALMGAFYASRRNGWDPDEMTALGRKWFALNIQAMKARYGERAFHGGEPTLHETYEFRNTEADRTSCFKALQCLRYQCAEGDIPGTDDYRRMSDIALNLGHAIIADTPAYQAAEWS